MLTPEQIKNLKPGDTVLVEATVFTSKQNGASVITFDIAHSLPADKLYPVPSPSKHDPCRLFRKGDKVRVVEWNGRHFHDRDHGTELTTGCICVVINDEEMTFTEGYINISVSYEGQVRYIAPCFLELITPVEELEPYVVEEVGGFYYVDSRNMRHAVCVFNKECHPHAKEAAEAERDRLNAEWRKEHP